MPELHGHWVGDHHDCAGSCGPKAELPTPAEAVVIRPGDRLVLRYERVIDMAQTHRMKDLIAERLPGVEAVIVSSCAEMMVYRGGDQDV